MADIREELKAEWLVYKAVARSKRNPSTPMTSIHQRSESTIKRTLWGLLAAKVFPHPVTSR